MAGFGQNKVRLSIRTLVLRHTWTTTMSSSTTRDTVHVEFEREGLIGYGEGAPIVRYGESALGALEALRGIVPLLAGGDPRQFTPWLAQIREALGPRQHAALSAVETAVCDWLGKRLGISLFEWFGLDPAAAPLTSFSIGMDIPSAIRAKVEEAREFPVLKIKVGLADDEATIEAVRAVTDKPIRVDANEGSYSHDPLARRSGHRTD
jgi:L-alanine-DL-glutamate epimerase-like enolase superfamily enzyme